MLSAVLLTACGSDPQPVREADQTPTPQPTVAPTATPTSASTPEPTPTETAAPVDTPTPQPTVAAIPTPTATFTPTATSTPESAPPTKLLAIYMVGSDLEEDGWAGTIDLDELIEGYESLPNPEDMEVIVAFGGANKDGWRGMKFADISQIMADAQDSEFGNEISTDAYLYQDNSANMGDESSLKLFLDYLRDGYGDFDQRFLTFWDHGKSYQEFGNDSNFNNDALSMGEIARAFQRSQPGSFDLIGFDACLMASVEVAKVIAPHANYMIASEDLEPGHGWLWSAVVQHYALEDSIVEAGKKMVDNFVQDVHGTPEQSGKTLSLLDLSQYDQLVTALNPVIAAYDDQLLYDSEYSDSLIAGSTRAQSYDVSKKDDTRTSIDLMHFTQLLAENLPDSEGDPGFDSLLAAIDRFVVHSNHDGSRPNSFGIAIDAPENAGQEYAAYKVNDTWLDFQDTFSEFRQTDTEPPELVEEFSDSDGIYATFDDENLSFVSSLYGFVEEDYFMVVAEEATYSTDFEGTYFAPTWNKYWFTVEYNPGEQTAWIPASFDGWFEDDGEQYFIYTAEIDYYIAGESTADPAVMTLIVNEDWEVVYHDIQTYQYIFSGPDDEEGTLQFDKATYQIGPGDAIQFWNYGFHMEDTSQDGWFKASDIVTFVQEPVFLLELLEFEDESGQLIEYLHLFWAEDISGNAAIS